MTISARGEGGSVLTRSLFFPFFSFLAIFLSVFPAGDSTEEREAGGGGTKKHRLVLKEDHITDCDRPACNHLVADVNGKLLSSETRIALSKPNFLRLRNPSNCFHNSTVANLRWTQLMVLSPLSW